jgi:hypothetical protein
VATDLDCFKNSKTWAYALNNDGVGVGISSLSIFLLAFIKDFGNTAANAQLFSVVPYACAFFCLPITALISDRINVKGPILIIALSVSSIGYITLLTVHSVAVKMVSTYFIAAGLYSSIVLAVTWLGINTGGFTKRGTARALAEIVAQLTSIVGSNAYTDEPRYIKGHSIALAFLSLAIANAVALIV